MSGCQCDNPTRFRATGEVVDAPPEETARFAVGSGKKTIRVRCDGCGGKVTNVGSELLEALGLDNSEIQPGACLDESKRVTLEVDLI